MSAQTDSVCAAAGAPLQAGIGFYFAPYIGGLVCKWERQTGPPLKN